MKLFRRALLATVALIGIFLAGFCFSTFDYGHRCTLCLRDYHVVERQFFGLTYWKSEKLRFDGYSLKDTLGSPCEHIYRQGGFGRSIGGLWGGGIGCGVTAEGGLFQGRWETLKAAFELDQTLDAPHLLRDTLKLADEIMPPAARNANADGVGFANWS